MTRVDAILTRFPGPVTLRVTRRKKLAMVAVAVGVAVFCAWLLFAERASSPPGPGEKVIAWIALLLSGWIAVVSAIQRRPGYLMLDADGFVNRRLFRDGIRTHWRDVSEFRLQRWPGSFNDKAAVYDVPGAPPGTRSFRFLPDNYGLTEDEIVRLMNAWRERALAGWHPGRNAQQA